MAAGEVTGADEEELRQLRGEYYNTPQFEKHDIPFEVAYCLRPIAKQPDEYDGEQRYCKRRVAKKDEEDYEGKETDKVAFAGYCHSHGGDLEKVGQQQKEHLDNPKTAAIKHGAHAEDEHLKMDFDEHEQDLYDEIMEEWPDIYDWPPKSEDPARYRILRRVAVNEVRALREEDYLDGDEVVEIDEYDEQGVVVGSHDEENPLAREYRLLMAEVTSQMRELGLTPREQQKMDTLEAESNKDDAITRVAEDALDSDEEYDPTQFNE
jgi:phage terminase small subunit